MAGPVGRVLIVGVSSYMGSALAVGLRNHYEVFGTFNQTALRIDGVTSYHLNCLNGSEILDSMQKLRPDAVLFCAGLTDIEECEANYKIAESLNYQSAALFFKVSAVPTRFYYYSTCNVFGGLLPEQSPPYTELHKADPINVYGTTKMHGENLVMGTSKMTCVARVSQVYGESFGSLTKPKNTWISWLRATLQKGEVAHCFADQVRTHVYIGDVIRATRKLLDVPLDLSSVYNIAGPDAVSRFEFAKVFATKFGFDPNLIKPISQATYPKYKASRPINCALSAKKFETDFAFKFQGINDGINELSERFRTGYTGDWA